MLFLDFVFIQSLDWIIKRKTSICRPEKFLDFDPRMRHTIWNIVVSVTAMDTLRHGIWQIAVQRSMALKTIKDVKL